MSKAVIYSKENELTKLSQDFSDTELKRFDTDKSHAVTTRDFLQSALNDKNLDGATKLKISTKIKLIQSIIDAKAAIAALNKSEEKNAGNAGGGSEDKKTSPEKNLEKKAKELIIKREDLFEELKKIGALLVTRKGKKLFGSAEDLNTEDEILGFAAQKPEDLIKVKKKIEDFQKGFAELGFETHKEEDKSGNTFAAVLLPEGYDKGNKNIFTMNEEDILEAAKEAQKEPKPTIDNTNFKTTESAKEYFKSRLQTFSIFAGSAEELIKFHDENITKLLDKLLDNKFFEIKAEPLGREKQSAVSIK